MMDSLMSHEALPVQMDGSRAAGYQSHNNIIIIECASTYLSLCMDIRSPSDE